MPNGIVTVSGSFDKIAKFLLTDCMYEAATRAVPIPCEAREMGGTFVGTAVEVDSVSAGSDVLSEYNHLIKVDQSGRAPYLLGGTDALERYIAAWQIVPKRHGYLQGLSEARIFSQPSFLRPDILSDFLDYRIDMCTAGGDVSQHFSNFGFGYLAKKFEGGDSTPSGCAIICRKNQPDQYLIAVIHGTSQDPEKRTATLIISEKICAINTASFKWLERLSGLKYTFYGKPSILPVDELVSCKDVATFLQKLVLDTGACCSEVLKMLDTSDRSASYFYTSPDAINAKLGGSWVYCSFKRIFDVLDKFKPHKSAQLRKVQYYDSKAIALCVENEGLALQAVILEAILATGNLSGLLSLHIFDEETQPLFCAILKKFVKIFEVECPQEHQFLLEKALPWLCCNYFYLDWVVTKLSSYLEGGSLSFELLALLSCLHAFCASLKTSLPWVLKYDEMYPQYEVNPSFSLPEELEAECSEAAACIEKITQEIKAAEAAEVFASRYANFIMGDAKKEFIRQLEAEAFESGDNRLPAVVCPATKDRVDSIDGDIFSDSRRQALLAGRPSPTFCSVSVGCASPASDQHKRMEAAVSKEADIQMSRPRRFSV